MVTMAIVSFTNYKRGQTRGGMGAVMRYTTQDWKTEFNGRQLVTGINCQPETAYSDFMTTKYLHHKTDGTMFYHMVQSFPKGADVDPVTAHSAALKLAEYFSGHEVLVCTQSDRADEPSRFAGRRGMRRPLGRRPASRLSGLWQCRFPPSAHIPGRSPDPLYLHLEEQS